jgi:hypothetical protein
MTDGSGVQQARDRVLQMARQIESLAQSNSPPDVFFPEFLRLLVNSMGGRAGAVWMLNGGSRLALAHDLRFAETGIRDDPQSAQKNERLLSEVINTGQASSFAPDDPAASTKLPANFLVILAALQIGEEPVGVVEVFQRAEAPREARPGFLQFVEQMAGHASRYLERSRTESRVDDSSKFLADFEQFLLQLQRGLSVNEVAVTAANDGRQLLGCDRFSVALHKGRKTSIAAISGQDQVNARANLTRAMAAIAARIVALREPITFSGRIEELPPQIEQPLANFIQESGSRMVALLPLFGPDPLIETDDGGNHRPEPKRPREVVGCLVIEQTSDSRPQPKLEARADMLAEHVGAVLWHAHRHDRILLRRTFDVLGRGREWFHGRKLMKTLAVLGIVAIVVGALCFVPWDYRIVGKGKLMPIRRQQVFAPENGDVIQIFVKGGETVRKDQPLLVLRNEQLTAELSDNESKLFQSRQQVSSFRAVQSAARNSGDDKPTEMRATADRARAEIEVRGLTRVVGILRERVDSLKVAAPLDGTVASFQLDQLLQNRPVQQGEQLLEVMDESGPWRLELDVEGNRLGHLLRAWEAAPDHKLQVEFIPATAAESTFTGELYQISSRSAVSPDQSNIFECFVSTDADKIPNRRIGAEVRAKINCGKRSLGYVLFGDVIEFIRQRLWL